MVSKDNIANRLKYVADGYTALPRKGMVIGVKTNEYIERVGRKLKIYKAADNIPYDVHLHNEYELIFVQDGAARINIAGEDRLCKKNTIIFIDSLLSHTMEAEKTPYVRYVMLINSDYFESFISESILRSIFSIKPGRIANEFHIKQDEADFIASQFDYAIAEYDRSESLYETCVMSILQQVLVYLFRKHSHNFPNPSQETEKILPVKSYIDGHFSNDITLDDIAEHFFINKYYLTHLFKKVTGYSPKQYVILKRISFARELLCMSDKNITEIASDCGFNSTSNFIRSFKSAEGMTPLEFRKAIKTGG